MPVGHEARLLSRCHRQSGKDIRQSSPASRPRGRSILLPELVAKVRDVVGLHLDPPQNAVVLCVNMKSQIQAPDRAQPILPMQPGRPAHSNLRLKTTLKVLATKVRQRPRFASRCRRVR